MAGRINITSNKVDGEDVDGDGLRVPPNADINSKHDFIQGVFGVSLKSASDIDVSVRELEEGIHPVWTTLDSETRSQVSEAMFGLFEVYELGRKANATNSDVVVAAADAVVADDCF
ncbi:hypothetical protein CTI12_AA581830 [Artemisia annua]|uniref:Uncharacterized protein n=1 Tax=Artemisia annua TaxID=35608 RepID=A0A2U1KNX3_ARTAN|nr:hypothetical protein CTI12_AA581830 [Artemisia annua]